MISKEFEELIENRTGWVKTNKKNEFDLGSIFSDLYNDPSHFIYEILQNAEDAGAGEVRFELFEDKLDVYHNGNDFCFEDIKGVTGYATSKKKDNPKLIGKFGIGFKSVFAVTETPYIFSGEYNGIKIEDRVIPSVVNGKQIDKTLISLPFNHKERSKEEVFSLLMKRLENLGLRTLLFLENIKEIKWQTPYSNGCFSKTVEDFPNVPNIKKVRLFSSSTTENYIVIGKPIEIDSKKLKVEIAYKLGKENDKEMIIQEPNSNLVVFFPTDKETYLNFIIHGPYKTTPSRESIPLEDEQNKKVIEETGNLVAESLSVIKKIGYFDTNFLSLLPINPEYKKKDNAQIYSIMYDKVKEKILSEELLPTSDGSYTKASDALLARGKELTKFLDKNDIQELFSKQSWLDTNITRDKTPELREYLINELEIEEIIFEHFARKIIVEFLQRKSDEWMIEFYSRLLGERTLWDNGIFDKKILRTKPIIRLDDGRHIAPFDNNGKIQVYLPTETKSLYKTVKRILTENDTSLKFLKELGLNKPDTFAGIREFIIPKYQKDDSIKDEKYLEDFEKLLTFYEDKTVSQKLKEEFIIELKESCFIDSVNNGIGGNQLKKPSEIYFNDKDIRDYFDGYHPVYFISDNLYEKFGKERITIFLKELGVEDKPKRIEIDGNLTCEEKNKIRGSVNYTEEYQKDYEYEGLENFISSGITLEKSCLLWKLLLRNVENLKSGQAKEFFEGKYKWHYYSWKEKSFVAKFLKTIRQIEWLFDKNNNIRKPFDITFSDLSDNYIKESSNIEILKKVFEFRPEIIDQLPETDKEILKIAKEEGVTPEEFKMLISERKEKSLKNEEQEERKWIPDCEPNTVSANIIEEEPDKIITPDLTGQEEKTNIENDKGQKIKNDASIKEDNSKSQADKKAIGDWGEKIVYNTLKKEYQKLGSVTETESGFKVINSVNEEFEIVWLNKHSDGGVGYDFVIKKDGIEIEYIDAKAKTQEDAELVEVTGTQWEFARKLFEQNVGEKYFFYVVLNAGKQNAQICKYKNPVKLWREGKLYAHPVNFRL